MAAAALARVDEEIAAVYRDIDRQRLLLSNLRSQRNSHLSISRLPTEMLATVFIYCAQEYYRNCNYPTRAVPNWVNISYVCRHWRDVALNCPVLWTYIFTTSQRWTKELLIRSKQAPLNIRANLVRLEGGSQALYLLQRVVNDIDRIQELRLVLPRTDYQFLHKFSSRASRLQRLEIVVQPPPLESSLVLFHGNTPALRTLYLTCSPLLWQSFTLNSLITLSLHHVPVHLQQSMTEFLAALGCLQGLKHLYLEDAFASDRGFLSRTSLSTTPRINLPHLTRFMIIDPLSTVITLLSCVNIPLNAELRLQCKSEDGFYLHNYNHLSSLLKHRFTPSDDQTLPIQTTCSLTIVTHSPTPELIFSTMERGWHDFLDMPHTTWGHGIPLKINFDSELMMPSDQYRIISNLCCSIPSTNIQSLQFAHPPLSSDFWRTILGHLESLRRISLRHGGMPDITSILSVPPLACKEGQGRYADQILVPALEELVLQSLAFCSENPQSLYDALSTRKESRGRLTIKNCSRPFRRAGGGGELFSMVGLWEDGRFSIVA